MLQVKPININQMATRSTIAIANNEGVITNKSYSHWDGYLSNNGIYLTKCYKKRRLKKLLTYGDLSALNPKILIPKGKKVTDFRAIPGVCLFYYRDRNEADALKFYDGNEEYNYVYYKGNYYVGMDDNKRYYKLILKREGGRYTIHTNSEFMTFK